MFCTKCGEKIEEGSKFCVKCGTPVNMSSVSNTQPTSGVFNSSVMSEQIKTNTAQGISALLILSILGFILLPIISLLSLLMADDYEPFIVFSILFFAYMITHSLISMIKGFKIKIMSLIIMGIIGILLFAFFSFGCIYNTIIDDTVDLGIMFTHILAFCYWLALAIVSIKKSKIIKYK